MSLREQKKINLDLFLTHRGININNCKLGENSIFLRKVLKFKRHQKSLSLNFPYISVGNTPIRSNRMSNKIIKNASNTNIFENNTNSNNTTIKKKFYISNVQSKEKLINYNTIIDTSTPYDYTERYSIIDTNRLFNTNINNKDNKLLFYGTMYNFNKSCENILNRFNKKKNTNIKTPDKNKKINSDVIFTPKENNNNPVIMKNNKNLSKMIYKKKNKSFKFNTIYNCTNTNVSRNKKKFSHTQRNSTSKNNSISHSIDFSIINKINLNDYINNTLFSKTSNNFYILNNKKKESKIQKITINYNMANKEKQNKSRNTKFVNHFIKYCYLYFILIIKKFFNNLKKISILGRQNVYSNNKNINNNFNLFDEFNKDDFDKETIKNKTAENFYDASNDNSFSFIFECKKNYVYNRIKRINNQNFQEKNLLQLLNNSIIQNNTNKIKIDNNNKNLFDNETQNNDIVHSPIFNTKISHSNKDKISNENNKSELTNNDMKEKNETLNNKIMGFIQINNEINPFNIKGNNINFFDKDIKKRMSQNKLLIFPENQQCTDEILSFRKKEDPIDNNTFKNSNIIKINNITTSDNKICIDMKYLNNNNFDKNNIHKDVNNKHLIIYNFGFDYPSKYKKIKKISAKLKEAKIIKENEDTIFRPNINNYLYNLSTIKEEESPFMHTYKKNDHYYTISNNSKLFSKTSIEYLIDGEKDINEEDIDKILFDSFSDYSHNKIKKLKKNQSQELMVVSNFNSVMRNRKNRKENVKFLIKGILCLIKFFTILCFNIRKEQYMKLKLNWKMNKFINYLIIFCLKKYLLKAKLNLDILKKSKI